MHRPMHPADLPRAAALSARVGWNQVAADWSVFLDRGAVRVVDDGDPEALAATAAVLPFGVDLAWISMVLVRPDRRRQGLATALVAWALAALANTRCVALDATPAGRPVYQRLGFSAVSGFARWQLPPQPAGADPRRVAVADWPAIAALDAAAFGAAREVLLRGFAARLPQAAFIAEDGGFVLARDGVAAPQIGPVVAGDATTAAALIAAASAALGEPAVLDAAEAAEPILAARGGTPLRPFTRMVRGRPPAAWHRQNFVLAGPEFG